jgi:hypothetical protein
MFKRKPTLVLDEQKCFALSRREVHFYLLQKNDTNPLSQEKNSQQNSPTVESLPKKLYARSKHLNNAGICLLHRLVSCQRKSAVFGYFAAEIN